MREKIQLSVEKKTLTNQQIVNNIRFATEKKETYSIYCFFTVPSSILITADRLKMIRQICVFSPYVLVKAVGSAWPLCVCDSCHLPIV